MNDEKVELEDITIYDNEQQYLRREMAEQAMGYQPDTDAEYAHNTLPVEQTIENIIRTGDTAYLKEWISSAPAVRPRVMAGDQLRQCKNLFVVAATLASRAAIRGRMEPEDALSLSDAFIQKCELLDSMERITNLQYRMVLEFTEQVEKLQQGANGSELAVRVTNYIQRHISQPVTAEALAKHLYLSRPYLSARFKAETGVSLTDFILRKITEEAKRLLCYSDKSMLNISSYLGFSSHGHFSRVFRKYAGCSPKEYREQHGS